MLLPKQVAEVAQELKNEAATRQYVKVVIPQLMDDDHFWEMLVEMFELVINRQGYIVVPRS